jgi:hypothetical protein
MIITKTKRKEKMLIKKNQEHFLMMKFVSRINQTLTDNFIHTFQFVSIDKTNEENLIWCMLSNDKVTYKKAVNKFIGIEEGGSTKLKRTLIYNENPNGNPWYSTLGSGLIDCKLKEYEYDQYVEKVEPENEHVNIPPPGYSHGDIEDLKKYWETCIGEAFNHKGAIIWVSQKHTNIEGNTIISSIFALFNKQLDDLTISLISSEFKNFIIDYIIDVYKQRAIKLYETKEDEFLSLLEKIRVEDYLSNSLVENLNDISPAINSNLPIFIYGETGTGKSILAKHIHKLSDRKEQKFISINCSEYLKNSDSFETKLFGQQNEMDKGIIYQLNRDTLFLDDVQTLPLHLQLRLKTFLESYSDAIKEGSTNNTVRFIFASNEYIQEEVHCGNFIEDLYYRINIISIHLPPLRERKDEIEYLVEAFLSKFNKEYKFDQAKIITKGFLERLQKYDYPGNIRELFNILLRSYIFSGKVRDISEKHLLFY